MKSRTKDKKEIDDPTIGDAWTFTAIERHSKLILAWHLGQRSYADTCIFTEKLAYATDGSFQVTTDGTPSYKDAIVYSLGAQRVDFAQLFKIYQNSPETETRYSPGKCLGAKKQAIYGRPDKDRAGTSIVERHNLSIRMETQIHATDKCLWQEVGQSSRGPCALSCLYNFCRMHKAFSLYPSNGGRNY
jgi:IS1 family transposase